MALLALLVRWPTASGNDARQRHLRLVKGSYQIAFRGTTQVMGLGAILCNWGTQDEEAVVQFQGLWTEVQEITRVSR